MTTTINASTSSGLVVTPDNSGNIVLQYNGQSAPAFSAYMSTSQTISATTWTKVALNAELFDTNNNFNTSTYRFQPTVAGYYQINGLVWMGTAASTLLCSVWVNGAVYQYGTRIDGATAYSSLVSTLVYLNGSTDYIELYAYSSTTSIFGQVNFTSFSGCLMRGA